MSSIPRAVFLLSTVLLVASAAAAQDIPGVRTTLVADQKIVSSGSDAVFVLRIEVDEAAELPGDLLTAIKLDTTVGDSAGPQIRENAGAAAGKVAVAAGTTIERRLTVPADRLAPAGNESAGMATVAVQWPGYTGANCVVQIAPDMSNVSVGDLDLAKTKVMLITNHGDMTVAFYPDRAPKTVENFVKLAMEGYYDGTKFHRVIRNFMIQGGDPNSRNDDDPSSWGRGGPGYTIPGEVNDTKHVRGVLSMANSGSPDTAGSQFFICHKDAPHLNQGYTAFGALESGLDTLDSIANTPVGGPQRSRPIEPVVLKQAVVLPVLK